MNKREKLIKQLEEMTSSANVSCHDFTQLLKDIGFEIEHCGNAGHKIAKHPAVDVSHYPNYNCGHNPGTKIKRVYINTIYKFVMQYEDKIKEGIK